MATKVQQAVFGELVKAAQNHPRDLALIAAKELKTGKEVQLIVLHQADVQGNTGLAPLAVLVEPNEAIGEYLLSDGEGGYDEKGFVWERREIPEW